MTNEITIVVPCFNEEQRLPREAFRDYVERSDTVRFLFVDDGSTDGTSRILQTFVSESTQRCEYVRLADNAGKAEAVRAGMLRAFEHQGCYVGYWDADLATPLSEIRRFVDTLEIRPELVACFGARVRLLGRTIRRRVGRHYGGRIFATMASLALGLPVYDTQCGAKLFRVSPRVRALFAEPFIGRWTFDVEIIARLALDCARRGGDLERLIYELPLDQWTDVGSSQVRAGDFARALVDLVRIRRRYFGHRQGQ